jgi:hypothetical protein
MQFSPMIDHRHLREHVGDFRHSRHTGPGFMPTTARRAIGRHGGSARERLINDIDHDHDPYLPFWAHRIVDKSKMIMVWAAETRKLGNAGKRKPLRALAVAEDAPAGV